MTTNTEKNNKKTPVDLPGGIQTHKRDKTNETKRKIAADSVLSLSKNIANETLVIKIDVT